MLISYLLANACSTDYLRKTAHISFSSERYVKKFRLSSLKFGWYNFEGFKISGFDKTPRTEIPCASPSTSNVITLLVLGDAHGISVRGVLSKPLILKPSKLYHPNFNELKRNFLICIHITRINQQSIRQSSK